MKQLKKLTLTTFIIFITLTIITISSCTKPIPQEKTIKIGAILPLTGAYSIYGKWEQQGIMLAVEEINSVGGINGSKLQMIYEDSKCLPKDGVAAAEKIISMEKPSYLISALTGVSLSIKPIVKDRDILLITYAMNENIPADTPNVFRLYPGIQEEGKIISEYIAQKGYKKVALLFFQQEAYETQIRDIILPRLKGEGITIIEESFNSQGLQNIRNQIVKLKDFEPEITYIGAYYNQLPILLKSLKEVGLIERSQIISGLNLAVSFYVGELNPELLNNTVVAIPDSSVYVNSATSKKGETKTSFYSKYQEKFGTWPTPDATYAYDSIKILAQIIAKVGLDAKKAIIELKTIKNYSGVSSNITVNSDGNITTSWVIGKFRDNKITLIKE
jgi:branched-chain amino acid transport system substrate-binding protein